MRTEKSQEIERCVYEFFIGVEIQFEVFETSSPLSHFDLRWHILKFISLALKM